MGTAERFETLEKLISNDRIGIDFRQKLVVLDSSIHLLYLNDDQKYAAFFDTVQAYMNMCRGAIGIKELITPEDKIDFSVVLKQYVVIDVKSGEFYDPPKESTKTLIVGYYQNKKVDYIQYQENQEGKSKETE